MSFSVKGFVFKTTSGKFTPLLLFTTPPTSTSVCIFSLVISLTSN